MEISVILVSYNTKEKTRDCLKSVYKYTKDVDFEVFVVDNNSHDGSPEMIEKEFPQVQLIRNPDNKGFGAANNIAIRKSNAKYIFCLNTDTLLLDNSIKSFYDFMEKEENQNIGACGCQLLDRDMGLQHIGGNFPTILQLFLIDTGIRHLFAKQFKRRFYEIKGQNSTTPFDIDYITGADLFIRKSVLDKVGLYDEDFFMYFEEVHLQYRMKQAGYKSVIIPTVKIIHDCGYQPKNTPLSKMRLYRESELLYWEKIRGKWARHTMKWLYFFRFVLDIGPNKEYFAKVKYHFLLH